MLNYLEDYIFHKLKQVPRLLYAFDKRGVRAAMINGLNETLHFKLLLLDLILQDGNHIVLVCDAFLRSRPVSRLLTFGLLGLLIICDPVCVYRSQ